MIQMLEPLSVGNAVRVILNPPDDADYWVVLRNTTGAFPSESDPNSQVVYKGINRAPVDTLNLTNGTEYFYCPFYWNGDAWTTASPVSGTPNATYSDGSVDPQSVVIARLTAGLAVEVQRGTLVPQSGEIPVLSAPPVFQDTRWPLVTVHYLSDPPVVRGLGELLAGAGQDVETSSLWDESEGWLARTQLAVIGWTQNPDERIALRLALRRLMVANLSVFDSFGMVEIEFSQQDVDAVSGEYPAPVYQAVGTFTCTSPVLVGSQIAEFTDVQVNGTALN